MTQTEEILVLLPLFPTMKLTLGPNWNGPRERWHMKFFSVMLSIRPMSPCRPGQTSEEDGHLQEDEQKETHRRRTDGGRLGRPRCIVGDGRCQSGLLQSGSITAAFSFPLPHRDGGREDRLGPKSEPQEELWSRDKHQSFFQVWTFKQVINLRSVRTGSGSCWNLVPTGAQILIRSNNPTKPELSPSERERRGHAPKTAAAWK